MKTKQVLNVSIHEIDTLLKYLYLGHSVTVPGYVDGTWFRFSMPNDDLSIKVEFKPNLGTGDEEFGVSYDGDDAALLTPNGLMDIIDILKEMSNESHVFNGKDRFEEIQLTVAAEMIYNR